MSLFRQLQEDILDNNKPLSAVLLRAKVFAARLPSLELRLWLASELEGYHDKEGIPGYRRREAINIGLFAKEGNLKEAVIQPERLPEPVKAYATELVLGNSVLSLEEILDSGAGPYKLPWPTATVKRVAEGVLPDYLLKSAWKLVPRTQIEGVLDRSRTKLLNLLLGLETTDPDILDSDEALEAVPAQRLLLLLRKVVYEADKTATTSTSPESLATPGGNNRLELEASLSLARELPQNTPVMIVLTPEKGEEDCATLSEQMKPLLRGNDSISAYRNHVVALVFNTSEADAERIAKRLRNAAEGLCGGKRFRYGVAASEEGDSMQNLFRRVSRRLQAPT